MTDAVLYQQQDHVITLTFNKPESRNLVTDSNILTDLNNACERITNYSSIRYVIPTGAGKTFSGGGKLKEMCDRLGSFAGQPAELRDQYRKGVQHTITKVFTLQVPTIAAVNGVSFDITGACDVHIAGDSAVFAENFVKVGIISGDCGSLLLPHAVGFSCAAEMTFTGEPVDASTAFNLGFSIPGHIRCRTSCGDGEARGEDCR